jgi:hypothetical protein
MHIEARKMMGLLTGGEGKEVRVYISAHLCYASVQNYCFLTLLYFNCNNLYINYL